MSSVPAEATGKLASVVAESCPPAWAKVNVKVAGTAFWGAMPTPARINWAALPSWPHGEISVAASMLADRVDLLADYVGCTDDAGSAPTLLADAVDPVWFSYIISRMRASPSYVVQSLFYAPSVAAVYVQVANARGDQMIVRFDPRGARLAADEDFDLDDGFGPGAPMEMHHDFVAWCMGTSLDPAAELLKLRAPYDAMMKPVIE